ncbi:DUF4388 domain-containing protein [Myxococcota bacterium]
MRFDGSEGQLEMLREIADVLPDPVFLVDRALNVWYHNRPFELATGVRMRSRRYKGLPCRDLLGLEICTSTCVLKQAVETTQPVRLAEIAGHTAGGERRVFNINAIPVCRNDGVTFGALIFLRDITAEADMQSKYKKLVERNSAISLSGLIEEDNLPDVIQLFSFLQKTGYLHLSRGDEDTGDVAFEKGKMVYIAQGESRDEKAFGRLVRWPDASFTFTAATEIEVPERISKSSDFLLMDAIREKDEINAQKTQIPARDCTPRVARDPEEGDVVDSLTTRVLELLQKGRDVGEVLDACPETDAACYGVLLELRAKGIIEW